ncbi:MAG: copper transporter [Nocardioides sp.]|nr:copper transporter [Nocardioides sp.]
MISFRYHVLTIVAVFLALAVGVALGGGPLSEVGRSGDSDEQVQDQSAEIEQASLVTSFQDEFAGDVSQSALNGVLKHRTVAFVTLPGSDPKIVQSLGDLVKQADGTIAGTYGAKSALLDPDNSALVSSLSAQIVESVPGTGVATTDPAYVRLGRLVGFTVGTRQDAGDTGNAATKNVLSSLERSEFLTRNTGNGKRASLVIIVLGDEGDASGDLAKLVAQLATGMAGSADGLVVAGTTESGASGLLKGIRTDDDFTAEASSTDSIQTLTGRVATVLTLAASASGKPGQYGANGSGGALPRG